MYTNQTNTGDNIRLLSLGGAVSTLLSVTLTTDTAILPPNTNMMMTNARGNPMSYIIAILIEYSLCI